MALADLILRDPFAGLGPLLDRTLSFGAVAASASFVPRIDAVEDGDAFRVTAELPGVEAGDLAVEIEDGVLTLAGQKRSRLGNADDGGEHADRDRPRLRRVETSWGRFERRLRFGVPIDEANVKASFRNGVLTVTVPKAAHARTQVRTIPVGRA